MDRLPAQASTSWNNRLALSVVQDCGLLVRSFCFYRIDSQQLYRPHSIASGCVCDRGSSRNQARNQGDVQMTVASIAFMMIAFMILALAYRRDRIDD